jgi:hypothetical protein
MRKAFLLLAMIAGFLVAPAMAQQIVAPYRYGSQPVVLIPNIDNWILGESGLLHYWPLSDSAGGATPGPCATQLVDSVAADTVTTVTPSPVPLNCSSPVPSPYPFLGVTGLVQDGTTATELTNGVGSLQGQWFTPAQAGLFSTICNANAGGSCSADFSVFCIVNPGYQNVGGSNYFFSADGTASGLQLGLGTNGLIVGLNGTALSSFSRVSSGVPYVVLYTYTNATATSSLYVDGVLAVTSASPKPQASVNSITYFGSQTGAANGWNGRLEKCAIFGDSEPASQARAQYFATGFW